MPAYLVGTLRILEADAYAAYGAAIRGLSAQFGGEPLVAGAVTEVMEGTSLVGERVVVTRFPSADQARAYLACDSYKAARMLRDGAVELELRLIEA